MAYEHMTYENILHRMIGKVTEQYPNLDTREGSVIFNALAPAAIELAIVYAELDNVLSESFADTASREYLLRKCEEIGIDVKEFEQTCGVHRGIFDVEVNIGSRWNCDIYNYTVTEYLGEYEGYYSYRMECETPGTSPNRQVGDLTPITEYPTSLGFAQVIECLIEGENETTDDRIREIYYTYTSNSAIDGNAKQYETWCELYEGIGNYDVIPLWDGANTVKVSILNSSNGVASSILVDEFQAYLDPDSEGMGNGVAPIGSKVTVSTATEVPLSIHATVKLKEGYTADDATNLIEPLVTSYIASLAYVKTTIPYFSVASTILNSDCVDAVESILLNGSASDVDLNREEIATINELVIEVVADE